MSAVILGKGCLHCGGPIKSRGPARDAKAIFCSRECRRSHERKVNEAAGRAPITRPCAECGTPFTYYASVRPNAAYCSPACNGVGHGRKMTGRIQESYRLTSTFRKSMRRFFYDRCAICGWDETPCDVCHIEARQNGGADELDNVIMLCPNHHRLFDLGRVPVEQVRAARDSILRPARAAEWQTWMQARGRLANAVRWGTPEDVEAARRNIAEVRAAILR